MEILKLNSAKKWVGAHVLPFVAVRVPRHGRDRGALKGPGIEFFFLSHRVVASCCPEEVCIPRNFRIRIALPRPDVTSPTVT